jgi:glucosylceramidase
MKIKVNENRKNQTILGFGGAFTDSATILMQSLSAGARHNLIHGYFSPEGIDNSIIRKFFKYKFEVLAIRLEGFL